MSKFTEAFDKIMTDPNASDEGGHAVSVGAPGSEARMRETHPKLIRAIDAMEQFNGQKIFDMIKAAGIKDRMSVRSLIANTKFRDWSDRITKQYLECGVCDGSGGESETRQCQNCNGKGGSWQDR